MTPDEINHQAAAVYAENVERGWWDDMNRCIFQTLQLVSTEIAEATEGERKDLMDDHLPDRKMGEVELADALIRLLDLAGRYGWKYVDKSKLDVAEEIPTVAGKHLIANWALCLLLECVLVGDYESDKLHRPYSRLVNTLFYIAEWKGYDIQGAVLEKLEYNRTRKDHSREARAQAGGKKF